MMAKKNVAIVLAAGQGRRMQSAVQKQFLEVDGKPLLYYSLKCFQTSEYIDEIILVTGQGEIAYCREEIVDKYSFDKVRRIVAGGSERYHSVYEGLKACQECAYVFVHDGARPLISKKIIKDTMQGVKQYRACVSAVKAKDTIKIADAKGFVVSTPNRESVWIVQTPQAFEYKLLLNAYQKCLSTGLENITDDAMIVEAMTQYKVALIAGDYRNIKVTTPEDLAIVKIFKEKVENNIDIR